MVYTVLKWHIFTLLLFVQQDQIVLGDNCYVPLIDDWPAAVVSDDAALSDIRTKRLRTKNKEQIPRSEIFVVAPRSAWLIGEWVEGCLLPGLSLPYPLETTL